MMSTGVKCNIKQEIKDLVAVSYNFFKKYPQKLRNTGCGGLLNKQNLLSMTKFVDSPLVIKYRHIDSLFRPSLSMF